jgi:hypothetical protein
MESFLLHYMPYAEIEWYLGFGLLGTGILVLLGAFVFEVKKQPRWIGAVVGLLGSVAVLILCMLVRPYVPESRFWGMSPAIMLTVSFLSCLSVTLPLHFLVWVFVKEGKSKNMENPYIEYSNIKNYQPMSSFESKDSEAQQ